MDAARQLAQLAQHLVQVGPDAGQLLVDLVLLRGDGRRGTTQPQRRKALPHLPIPFNSYWGSYRAAVLPVALDDACGRSHSDTWVGCIVWSATASSSTVRASRSTWSRRRALNASMVLAAS
jgi:hypothetical protein